MTFDLFDKFESIAWPASTSWDSTLTVAMALSHASAGAIFVVKDGSLTPVASTLSQEGQDRLQRSHFLTDLRVDTISGTVPAATSFLRLPVTEGGRLVGLVYLEGADTTSPRVL